MQTSLIIDAIFNILPAVASVNRLLGLRPSPIQVNDNTHLRGFHPILVPTFCQGSRAFWLVLQLGSNREGLLRERVFLLLSDLARV